VFSCRDVLAALREVLDDPQAEEMRRSLFAHLEVCRSCTALYDSMTRTIRLTSESGSFELPTDLSSRIMRKIADQPASGEPRLRPRTK